MLEELRKDIEILVSRYETSRQENANIRKELQESRELIAAYRKRIEELESQIDNFNLMNAFLPVPGDSGAREKIDRLIKDIDKCISLLEK